MSDDLSKNDLSKSDKFRHLVVSNYEIGLTKLIGKPIKEIRGYIASEYGAVFQMTKIEFADGTFLGCKGEHDYPYVVSWAPKGHPEYCAGYDDDVLEEIYDAQNDDGDDE